MDNNIWTVRHSQKTDLEETQIKLDTQLGETELMARELELQKEFIVRESHTVLTFIKSSKD